MTRSGLACHPERMRKTYQSVGPVTVTYTLRSFALLKMTWLRIVILNEVKNLLAVYIMNRHPEEGQAQGVVECDTLTMPRRGDLPLFKGGGERLVSVSAMHYNQW